jgi:hypothetical protein
MGHYHEIRRKKGHYFQFGKSIIFLPSTENYLIPFGLLFGRPKDSI